MTAVQEELGGGSGACISQWRLPLPGEWPLSEPPEALGILPAPLQPPLEVTAALGSGQAAPPRNAESTTPTSPRSQLGAGSVHFCLLALKSPSRGWESCWGCLLKEEMGIGERTESTGALGAPACGLSVRLSGGPGLFCFPDPLLDAVLHRLTPLWPPASRWVTACPLGQVKAPWTSPHLPVGLKREDNCRGSLGANP